MVLLCTMRHWNHIVQITCCTKVPGTVTGKGEKENNTWTRQPLRQLFTSEAKTRRPYMSHRAMLSLDLHLKSQAS